jgi:site-specific recombinase XerD
MKTNFSLLFYLKKPKKYQGGPRPVYMRITFNGDQKELATGKHCEADNWCSVSSRLKGTKETVKSFNSFLDALQRSVEDAHTTLVKEGKPVTAVSIKNRYLGIEEDTHKIVGVFKDHNDEIEALVGKGFTKATLTKYNSTLKHLKGFLKSKLKVSDLEVTKIDPHFVSQFGYYIRTNGKCANNATAKHLKNFGKVVRICLKHRWMTSDPFMGHKNKVDKVVRHVLSPSELQTLNAKEFKVARLGFVRDVFLFCCYTGLSFIDVQELSKAEIKKGYGDSSWILKKRHKTNIASHIPLLPIAEAIVDRYQDDPRCTGTGRVFPILSNQKMNAYLQELADLCGIEKHLTFHIARHTFATTITLGNGVPIETVSKMLGHTDIRTTQIYAQILDNKVGDDMAVLEAKLGQETALAMLKGTGTKTTTKRDLMSVDASVESNKEIQQEARIVKLFG